MTKYAKIENETVKEWLSEYSKPKTKTSMQRRLNKFLAWYNKPIEDLIALSSKEAKHLVLKYQTEQKELGMPNNTLLSIITAIRALFKYLEKPLTFGRGRLVNLEEARNKHQFSNGDLGKMFDVADLRGKAIITLGVSLGWAISDVLALDKGYIETLIARAQANNEKFIFFKRQRIKTGAKALGIINPLALEWLSKWLKKNKTDNLFDISHDMINKDLQRLAIEAQLKLLGKVSYHCFRGWTFSSLVKSGFSEFESKYVVGKSIPLSDSTYLNLEESIKEKYKEQYEKYFNIKPQATNTKNLALAEENKQQRKMIKVLLEKVENMEKGLSHVTTRLDFIETNVLGITRKRKDS